MKKTVAILSVVVMLFVLCTSSYAEFVEPGIQPLYNNIKTHNETLSISGGVATARTECLGESNVTKIMISITFQKKTLLSWSDVETWTNGSSSSYKTYTKSINVQSGTYRIKVVYTVYCGSTYETMTAYSSKQSC